MGKRAGEGKRVTVSVAEAVKVRWRGSAVRAAMREATGLEDAAIEAALARTETEQALAEYAQVMVRESLVPVLEAAIARAQKENTAARTLLELAEAGRLVGLKKPEGPTPEEEVSAFERAILGNLRELLRDGEKQKRNTEEHREGQRNTEEA